MPEERLLEMLRDVAYDLQGPDVNFECYIGNGYDFFIDLNHNPHVIKFSKLAEKKAVYIALQKIESILRDANYTNIAINPNQKSRYNVPEYMITFN